MTVSPVSRSIPTEESTRHFEPILQPDLSRLYAARQARLTALTADNPSADYLSFVAIVAGLQNEIVPLAMPGSATPEAASKEDGWIALLRALTERLREMVPVNVQAHLDTIAALTEDDLRQMGVALVAGRFSQVDTAIAPLLWAALSVQVAASVRAVPVPSHSAKADCCPVCATAPVASLIYGGSRRGLRYLHCALCESEWHVVRVACSNCGSTHGIEYLSLDTVDAVVQAECCNHCHSYLKIVSQERDSAAEAVTDDLAMLPLDDAVTAEGYQRTGFNPWALPSDLLG